MTDPALKQRENFFGQIPVSRETEEKLEAYAALLIEWNAKFNLVSKSTLPDLWERHMLDSAQLLRFVPPETRTHVDLGSGAGFPGLVLSILGVPETHLIESTGKKAKFLEHVARELGLNVTVHNTRIENVLDIKADLVTARALTSLPELLSLARPIMKDSALALFLKGEKADAELTEARKYWTFACDKRPSLTSPSGTILLINDLKAQRSHDAKRSKR